MRAFFVSALVACCLLAVTGCLPDSGDITVHVNSNCNLVYADGSSANPLEIEPGDKVKWINDNDNRVYIDFQTGEIFGRSFIRLGPGHSTVTTVKSSAANYEGQFSVDCGGDDGSGNPKVKVGDGDEP